MFGQAFHWYASLDKASLCAGRQRSMTNQDSYLPLMKSDGTSLVPEFTDEFFKDEPLLVAVFDFDYDLIEEFKSQLAWAKFLFTPPAWMGVLCCVPCFINSNVQWTARAKHVALTHDGIKYVEDKHPTMCGLSCTDSGKVSKTVPYEKITATLSFTMALEHIFLNAGHTPEEVDEIADRFTLGAGDTLSYEEFCDIVGSAEADPYTETMEAVEVEKEDRSSRARVEAVQLGINSFRQICDRRYASMRESFRALDKSRRSSLSPQEFAHGLSMHGINFQPAELQAKLRPVQVSADGLPVARGKAWPSFG
eukprot:s606_g2.t1